MSAYLTGLYQSAHLDKTQTGTHAVSDTTPSLPEDEVRDASDNAVEGDASSTEQV